MNGKRAKENRRKSKQLANRYMTEFFNSLNNTGLGYRLKICFKIIFTKFRLFEKKNLNKFIPER